MMFRPQFPLGTLLLGLVCGAGCDPRPEPGSSTSTPPGSSTGTPAAGLAEAASKAAETVQQVAGQAQAAAAVAADKVRELVDSAKKLAGDNKWEEALKLLQDAKALQLTPERRSMIDGLVAQFKEQMSKAALQQARDKAGAEIGKSLDGLLKK
jgi:hypothetical protein